MRHTSESHSLPPRPVRLRICEGEGERIVDASVSAIEQAFAQTVFIHPGTEISLSDGTQILVALCLGRPESSTSGQTSEFLLSTVNGEHASLSGPITREEALRQFREFMLAGIPGKVDRERRVRQ
jgi:hypothetical protein